MNTPSCFLDYRTLEQFAEKINNAPVKGFEEHTPEFLAAAYACNAQNEAELPICEDSADFHFDVLEEAGATFNRAQALDLALS